MNVNYDDNHLKKRDLTVLIIALQLTTICSSPSFNNELLFQPSWIRGYAFNNSRALHRRRSSVTEYVAPMDDPTLASNTQQQVAAMEVVRAPHRPKLRGTKSLCQAENMRFIHEESPSRSGLTQLLDPVEEYKRELREEEECQKFCLPQTRMEMEGSANFHLNSSQCKAKQDQVTSPYLDMECGRGRRAVSGQDVKPTMVA